MIISDNNINYLESIVERYGLELNTFFLKESDPNYNYRPNLTEAMIRDSLGLVDDLLRKNKTSIINLNHEIGKLLNILMWLTKNYRLSRQDVEEKDIIIDVQEFRVTVLEEENEKLRNRLKELEDV